MSSQYNQTFLNPPEDYVIDKRKPESVMEKKDNKKLTNVNSKNHDYRKLYKIENEEENFRTDRVDKNISRKIIDKRVEMKLSRKELAQKLNIKEQVLAEYETGKAVVDNKIMNKIRNILNFK